MDSLKQKAQLATSLDGSDLRVAIVYSRWNAKIVDALVSGAVKALENHGVKEIIKKDVPGAFELPLAASHMFRNNEVDAVICVGCLIKGETYHFEYICEAVSHGVMRVGLDIGKPCIFGVLTCLTEEQAAHRSGISASPNHHNHGLDWGSAAVEMALLYSKS